MLSSTTLRGHPVCTALRSRTCPRGAGRACPRPAPRREPWAGGVQRRYGSSRPDCALIDAATLTDGDLYRWRTIVDGWVGDGVASDWEFFRPQVWPPSHTVTVREPIVHQDGSATIDVEPIGGVASLRHDVTVRRRVGDRAVVARHGAVRSTYRTPSLEPGEYVIEAFGYNDQLLEGGYRASTPTVTVIFSVDERLQSQFRWSCTAEPCVAGERVRFSDESLTARNVPIVEWEWDFGDGSGSTQANPVHRYASVAPDGVDGYDVRLRVWDSSGRSSTRYQRVQVDPLEVDPPTAAFTHTSCEARRRGRARAPGQVVEFDPSPTSAPRAASSRSGSGTSVTERPPPSPIPATRSCAMLTTVRGRTW